VLSVRIAEVSGKYTRLEREQVPLSLWRRLWAVDNLRFASGAEWGESPLGPYASRHIFRNPNAAQGLPFSCAAVGWDMQAPYRASHGDAAGGDIPLVECARPHAARQLRNTARHLRMVRRLRSIRAASHGCFASTIPVSLSNEVARRAATCIALSARFTAIYSV